MAKKLQVVSKPITSLDEPWCDAQAGTCHDIEDIEDLIKARLKALTKEKVGYVVIPQTKDTDGYYHVWGFADQYGR